jgi:hypothetical protein
VGLRYSVGRRGLNEFESVKLIQTDLNSNLNPFELHLIQTGPSWAKNELKYNFKGFEERNNFFHRYFFRFEVYFE